MGVFDKAKQLFLGDINRLVILPQVRHGGAFGVRKARVAHHNVLGGIEHLVHSIGKGRLRSRAVDVGKDFPIDFYTEKKCIVSLVRHSGVRKCKNLQGIDGETSAPNTTRMPWSSASAVS